MATIIYTAKRSLAPGHVEGEEYLLEIGILDDANRRVATEKDVQRSLGGAMETLRHRHDVMWTLTLEPTQGKNMPLVREFLDSTDGGEAFSIDLYGQYAQMVNVKRIDTQYSETAFMRVGSADADYFQAQIEVLEI